MTVIVILLFLKGSCDGQACVGGVHVLLIVLIYVVDIISHRYTPKIDPLTIKKIQLFLNHNNCSI